MSENYNQPLSYIRPTPEKEFPAELVVRRPNDTDVGRCGDAQRTDELNDDAVKLVERLREQERKTNGK